MRMAIVAVALLAQALGSRPARAQMIAEGLQPGDMIRIKIWREPDLSGEFQVDERGMVALPKIGALSVTRLSGDSLKTLLVRSYGQFLREPSIDVALFRRVNVLGAVRSPGLYQVSQTETIGDVLAKAGGANSDGKPDRVELLRRGDQRPIGLQRDALLFRSSVRSGDQLFVPQRSWFARNSGALVGAGVTASAIIIATIIKP
jgi:protein involved in polysaccharide export with SLBB domain